MDGKQTIYTIVVGTLGLVLVAVVCVMLIGLFDPQVDNAKIFEIIGPAFQTIVGCFVGILGSRVMGETKPPPP